MTFMILIFLKVMISFQVRESLPFIFQEKRSPIQHTRLYAHRFPSETVSLESSPPLKLSYTITKNNPLL